MARCLPPSKTAKLVEVAGARPLDAMSMSEMIEWSLKEEQQLVDLVRAHHDAKVGAESTTPLHHLPRTGLPWSVWSEKLHRTEETLRAKWTKLVHQAMRQEAREKLKENPVLMMLNFTAAMEYFRQRKKLTWEKLEGCTDGSRPHDYWQQVRAYCGIPSDTDTYTALGICLTGLLAKAKPISREIRLQREAQQRGKGEEDMG
eukprot:TRINITY_DN7004_c0_g1_i1.p1 TRINITY_DN7004_c0_g1~~TRINITY_DN7004_c0_g1_i1.p1  ORF type:complete len:202 (+),score=43.44 TRINITY_DN7004_c0_g1_i1:63-668(+)